MTTVVADDQRARRPSEGRLGALAAVTPIAMFGAWTLISGWGGTRFDLARSIVLIGLGAVAAGWILGPRIGGSNARRLVGTVAYAPVGYLVLLPVNVVGAIWDDIQAGPASNAIDVVTAAGGYLLYGVVSAAYVGIFLIPFGAAWMLTFLLLRRGFYRS